MNGNFGNSVYRNMIIDVIENKLISISLSACLYSIINIYHIIFIIYNMILDLTGTPKITLFI